MKDIGLVPYSDEDATSDHQLPEANDKDNATRSSTATTAQRLPQIKIRRQPKSTTRARPNADLNTASAAASSGAGSAPVDLITAASENAHPHRLNARPTEETDRLRRAVQPSSPTGSEDWGIPPASSEPCNPAIEAKLSRFHTLKQDASDPRHFNDELMAKRSFRNPHLYAQLVNYVDVDERSTNFPKHVWDPQDVHPSWFADKIAELQKARSEQQSQSQGQGKRQLEFVPSSSSSRGSGPLGGGLKRKESRGAGYRHQPYPTGGGDFYAKGMDSNRKPV
ncbi:HCNGP-like protein-domain-containing protein [Pterulicium gracile]|uniref:HCNGP-like protein-domain-containing protein n=1 Tax=Pterulicium gracile TaxID=1884261 RepID=A0A5C3QIF7_9AGAR|nr:HCNGP-like protein-domain-containing protein [Pterula gracilis]